MAPTFEDFIQSPQFTFYVGPKEKAIVVHEAAIAAISPQLDALINNGMGESQVRVAKLKEVEVKDFIRFCEYAYRGDYTVPSWEEEPPKSSSAASKSQGNGEESSSKWASSYGRGKKKKKGIKAAPSVNWDEAIDEPMPESEPVEEMEAQSVEEPYQPETPALKPPSRAPLRTQYFGQTYLIGSSSGDRIRKQFEPKSNTAANQNFAPVFLAHARLYTFAHMRLIEPLKALTLEKLHKTLKSFELYTKRIGDVIALARYAYENKDLPDRDHDGTPNDLRKLVVEYIVCEIDTIGKSDEFVKYMEEGGEFVGDFWRLTREYVT